MSVGGEFDSKALQNVDPQGYIASQRREVTRVRLKFVLLNSEEQPEKEYLTIEKVRLKS